MEKVAILFGALMIALGVVGYTGAGSTGAAPAAEAEATETPESKQSITALIPAFFGVGLVVCGVLAFKTSLRKHAMHGAAMIGLLGVVAGAGRGAMGLGKFFSGDPSLNQRSFLFVWILAALSAVFLALCIRSFIAVRKQREAAESTDAA